MSALPVVSGREVVKALGKIEYALDSIELDTPVSLSPEQRNEIKCKGALDRGRQFMAEAVV